jgi:hypothetical protein
MKEKEDGSGKRTRGRGGGTGRGSIDLQEIEWPITTTDGEKEQGPNCSNGKYRPWQWHNWP